MVGDSANLVDQYAGRARVVTMAIDVTPISQMTLIIIQTQ